MMTTKDQVEYARHWLLSVDATPGGFVAEIERADRGPISSGYSFAQFVRTPRMLTAEAALDEARGYIDREEVKLHPPVRR